MLFVVVIMWLVLMLESGNYAVQKSVAWKKG